jgi:phage tail-like protein
VEIQGIPGPIFVAELTGIGSESDAVAVEQKSVSGQTFIQNVPGRLKWKDIVIKRGLSADRSFWTWRAQVEKGDLQGAFRAFSISFLDSSLRQAARWEGVGGWPSRLIIATPASASQATLMVEELTITHSGLTRTQ